MLSCWDESKNKRLSFKEMVMELEYVIAPLAAYMDFTQYYRQKNEKLY